MHALWTVITKGKKGYSKHPETLRWVGKQRALYLRHEELVHEMKKRGYNHLSDLDKSLATGSATQDKFLHSLSEQIEIIRKKHCGCETD